MLRVARTVLAAVAATAMLCASAQAITVTMFAGLGDPDAWEIVPMPGNTIWVIGNHGYGYVTPGTGVQNMIGATDAAVISMPDGSFWGTGASVTAPIAHVSSARTAPTYLPGLPSGGVPNGWARGVDGTLWFTEKSGTYHPPSPSAIGHLDPLTGVVTELGGLSPNPGARAIVAGPDGNMWFLESFTNSVGRITPARAVAEFPLPADVQLAQGRGHELTVGPGSDLFFLTSAGVARMTTAGRFVNVTIGGLPDFAADSIAYGRDGNLWATECAADTVTRISPEGVFTRAAPGMFPSQACPSGITTTPDGTPWLFEFNTSRAGRVAFDSPLASTDDPTEVDPTAAALNGQAAPRGAATTVRFEYGSTTAYGRSTPPQAIGDQDASVPVSARLTDLQPSTTYHYSLVAESVIGTVRGDDQTVTTAAPLLPPPADRDGDGYFAGVDCDDLSAAIHPGAYDKPGDRVDQDCSGADASYQHFQPHASAGWKTVRGRIVFTRMLIDAMPAGSSVKLSCSGRGCMQRGYAATLATPVKQLDVTKRLKGARLAKGAKVELSLSRPGYITTIVRWTIGPPPKVTILCQPPGARRPGAC